MDFLTTLYSYENFGIILFIIISILVLAFLIVLFFGKKDQKERQLAKEEGRKETTNNIETKEQNAFQDIEPKMVLEISENPLLGSVVPESEENIQQSETSDNLLQNNGLEFTKNDSNPSTVENDLTDMVPNPRTSSTPIIENTTEPKPEFDFDALAASISKELENINGSPTQTKQNSIVEPVPMPSFEPIIPEPPKESKKTEDYYETSKQSYPEEPKMDLEKPREEANEKPKMPSPNIFSSVFVTKKNEENMASTKTVQEEPKEEVIPKPMPAKPSNMELPKKIELPKLNSNSQSEPIIKDNMSNIVFPSLENDIPAYHKNDENRM